MKYLKAFIAGLALPAALLPVVIFVISLLGKINILEIVPIYVIPWIWGVWNVLYFTIGEKCPIKKPNLRLWITGATLGFLLALVVVFGFKAPALLFGLTGYCQYLPLIAIPLVYSILWRFIVKHLNSLVGLKEW